AEAKSTAEGRFTLVSLTATIRSAAPPKPPEKEKTPSLKVSLTLGGAPTLLAPGDTPDVKVTVSAGEEAVTDIKFSGDPLRATGSAVTITGGSRAPPPFSLAPGGSRSFTYATKATVTGTTSLRSAVTGVGPKGEKLSSSAGIDLKVQKS